MGVVEVLLVSLVMVGAVGVVALAVGEREAGGVGMEGSFESGFMSMTSEMYSLSVRFFVLGVVFLLLDLETAVIISTPLSLSASFEMEGLIVVSVVWVYLLGTLYEWEVGSLEWFS
uniref:NADH-ubiquinone oxidoreductase chain 3 n=1 Tax=Centrorhynchus milvus TaxID=2594319 RepID=A0A515KYX6_9BILA|nr:NADH dehydrogenase subunit 3 [Centrorhynchus milvus]